MSTRLARVLLAALLGIAATFGSTQVLAAAEPRYFLDAMWGSYGSGNKQFSYPTGVAVDRAGNVYVADTNNHRIQKFTSKGTYLDQWGSEGAGVGQLLYPKGIAVDAQDNVYIADTGNNRVQKFTAAGAFVGSWGSAGTTTGKFRSPQGVAVDSLGAVYIADAENYRIQKFDSSGRFLDAWGSQGTGDGQFERYDTSGTPRDRVSGLHSLAVDAAGNVYVGDSANFRVQVFDSSGGFIQKWGTGGSGDGQFRGRLSVCADGSGGVFVASENPDRVQKFDSSGMLLAAWGSSGTDSGQFLYPAGVCVNQSGSVYVVEQGSYGSGGNRIQRFSPDGSAPTVTCEVAASYRDAASVSLAATDDVSGVASLSYKLDGNAVVTLKVASTIVEVNELGAHTLKVWATDNAGNVSADSARSFQVHDGTPPTVACSPNDIYVGTATIPLSATDTGSAVASVSYRLDDEATVTASGAEAIVNTDALGAHELLVWAQDASGNACEPQLKLFTVGENTSVQLSASNDEPSHGAVVRLAAHLSSGRTTTLSGRTIVFERSTGSGWAPVASAFTDSAGYAYVSVVPINNARTTYRARFAGLVPYLPSTSDAQSVTPRVYLSNPSAPTRVTRSRGFDVTGLIKPRHSAYVRVYAWRYESGKWRGYGYVAARTYVYSATASQYYVKMAMGRTGRWRLRAYAPSDGDHSATWSAGYDYVTVR